MIDWSKMPRLLTPKQVGFFLRLPQPFVYGLIKSGKVRVVWQDGRRYVTRDSVRKWFEDWSAQKDEDAA